MSLYRFSKAELDTRARRLVVDGRDEPLQPKVFDLLVYLLEHRDRAVSKDELQEVVWNGVIVTEASLTRAIMKARRAVGDDAESQHTIRTIHGHGYQFIAPLAETAPTADKGQRQRPVWPAIAATALAALVLVGLLFGLGRGRASGTRIAVLPVELEDASSDLSWVPLGLMSYVTRAIADSTRVDVVPSPTLLSSGIAEADRDAPDFATGAMEKLDATHLVQAALLRQDDGYALEYRVMRPESSSIKRRLIGNDPIGLADQMAREIIAGLPGTGIDSGFRTVSDDTFVNEAYARGMSFQLQGDTADARGYFELAAKEDPTAFWPRYELALVQRDSGELEAAADALQSLLTDEAVARSTPQKVAAHNALGILRWRSREYDLAREHLDTAMELTDVPKTRVAILINLGILARAQDDLEAARNYLGRALAIHQDLGEPVSPHIYQTLANVEYDAGDADRAQENYLLALKAARREGDRRSEAASINSLAGVDRQAGRWTSARERAARAYQIRTDLGDRFGMLSSLALLARIGYESGDPEEALRWIAELDALAARTEASDRYVRNAAPTRIRAFIAMNDLEAARSSLEASSGSLGPVIDAMLSAELTLASGNRPEAAAIANSLIADPNLPPDARIDALLLLARASTEPDTRVRHASQALELARANREGAATARCLLLLIEADRGPGHAERNQARIAELRERFSEWRDVAALAPAAP